MTNNSIFSFVFLLSLTKFDWKGKKFRKNGLKRLKRGFRRRQCLLWRRISRTRCYGVFSGLIWKLKIFQISKFNSDERIHQQHTCAPGPHTVISIDVTSVSVSTFRMRLIRCFCELYPPVISYNEPHSNDFFV